jgi:hypothetical protein
MTHTETLRLALEALEYEAQKGNDNAYQSEREAIKAALEAKDEPVAWRDAAIRLGEELSSVGPNGYYNMSAKEWLDWAMEQNPRGEHSLPQRTWVGLTEEEMEAAIPFGNLSGEYSYDDILNIILLIQAKLRSKNHD